mmetsp:Transcript_18804/g.31486  ORF Transcript_18804/g.31486 Transcript_18804/m.31486 type:complete len:154 (+) Transcript_18804:729-1190(+)
MISSRRALKEHPVPYPDGILAKHKLASQFQYGYQSSPTSHRSDSTTSTGTGMGPAAAAAKQAAANSRYYYEEDSDYDDHYEVIFESSTGRPFFHSLFTSSNSALSMLNFGLAGFRHNTCTGSADNRFNHRNYNSIHHLDTAADSDEEVVTFDA